MAMSDSMNEMSYRNEPVPQTVIWYKVYCGGLMAVYFLVMFLGIIILVMPLLGVDSANLLLSEKYSRAFLIFYGALLTGLGLIFGAAFLLGIIFPPRPWSWIYGIVLISIGFSSLCCMMASIPLLIFWLKDPVKKYFGK
jgi:hypothetical protein